MHRTAKVNQPGERGRLELGISRQGEEETPLNQPTRTAESEPTDLSSMLRIALTLACLTAPALGFTPHVAHIYSPREPLRPRVARRQREVRAMTE